MRAWWACWVAGALVALGFAPHDLWLAGFVSIPLFFNALSDSSDVKQAMRRGFAFGYGYWIAGTWWIANALLVDSDRFAWLVPVSVLGLSAVLALWFLLFAALFWRMKSSKLAVDIIRFSVLWVAVEYARSLGMFGFPWNLMGSMAVSLPPLLQLASLVGSYGLSLVVVLIFLLPLLWMGQKPCNYAHKMTLFVAFLCIFAAFLYGFLRLPTEVALTPTRLRVVQGNIPQALKWTRAGDREAEQTYSALTRAPSTSGTIPTLIIWPETAVPIPLREGATWPLAVGKLLPLRGTLLTGAMRLDMAPDTGEKSLWNSLLAISEHGALRAVYDKHQLVPFGEFVPLRNALPLEKITPGSMDFSRGVGPQTLALEGVPPFRPLICYEVVFPWISASYGDVVRPNWLLNVTNDAWYGDSPGPYQHLAMAQLRAVEQGLPLVRAANTGVSALIDPYGRLMQHMPLNQRGFFDASLPEALPPTPYARWGDALAGLLAALMLLASYVVGKKHF